MKALAKEMPKDGGASWFDQLRENLPDCRLRKREPLNNKNTLRVGGAAEFFAEPSTAHELAEILSAADAAGVPIFILGRGSNIIIPDEGYPGLVIRLNTSGWKQVRRLDETRVEAWAGVRLKALCGETAKLGMAGFEFLEGIPGNLGGALRMNAGAMGGWMFDVVESVELMELDGSRRTLLRDQFHFGYRECREVARAIAIRAVLRAASADESSVIRARITHFASQRKESQPREPSAGCIFKNPDGEYAGRLVDEAGLKGLRVGNAQVSNIHGNFIVNLGGAKAAEVVELVSQVRERIKSMHGVELDPEVLLLGKSWEEVL